MDDVSSSALSQMSSWKIYRDRGFRDSA